MLGVSEGPPSLATVSHKEKDKVLGAWGLHKHLWKSVFLKPWFKGTNLGIWFLLLWDICLSGVQSRLSTLTLSHLSAIWSLLVRT